VRCIIPNGNEVVYKDGSRNLSEEMGYIRCCFRGSHRLEGERAQTMLDGMYALCAAASSIVH